MEPALPPESSPAPSPAPSSAVASGPRPPPPDPGRSSARVWILGVVAVGAAVGLGYALRRDDVVERGWEVADGAPSEPGASPAGSGLDDDADDEEEATAPARTPGPAGDAPPAPVPPDPSPRPEPAAATPGEPEPSAAPATTADPSRPTFPDPDPAVTVPEPARESADPGAARAPAPEPPLSTPEATPERTEPQDPAPSSAPRPEPPTASDGGAPDPAPPPTVPDPFEAPSTDDGTGFDPPPAPLGREPEPAGRPAAVERPVPDVLGLPRPEAQSRLRQAGFLPQVLDRTGSPALGLVVRQEPPPGSPSRTGEPVELSIGTPQGDGRIVSIPDVTGLELRDAVTTLLGKGFLPLPVAAAAPRAADGRVAGTSPRAGSSARTGGIVRVEVASPSTDDPVEVPSVVGLARSEASERLSFAGFAAQELIVVRVTPGVFRWENNAVLAQWPSGRVAPSAAAHVTMWIAAVTE